MEMTPCMKDRKQYCSKQCMGQMVGKTKGTKNYGYKNKNIRLLEKLGIKYCQIKGCKYNRSVQLHRWPIEGKNGGKYEIGNIVVLCPNHHIEFHTGWIDLKQINGKLVTINKAKKL